MRYRVSAVFIALLVGSVWAAEEKTSPPGLLDVSPDELPTHIVKVLRTTNKAQTNRYVPKVYELKNVNPFDVMRFFRRAMEIEEGRWATFLGPDGKSGLVVLIAPIYQIPYLDKLMAIIDRPGLTSSSGDAMEYYRLKHRAADDVGFLQTLYGQATHSSSKPPHGTRAGDIDMIADLETGSIFVYAPPSVTEKVGALIEELDKPMPQVLVEASVYEVDLNNDGAIGFDYYSWKNGPGRNAFALGAFAEYGKTDRLKGGVPVFDDGSGSFGLPHHRFRNHGYNAAYYFDVSSAYFDFLVAKGVARVITSGRILSKIPANYHPGLNEYGQVDYKPDKVKPTVVFSPAAFRSYDEVLYYRALNGPAQRGGARPPGYVLDPFGDDVDYPDNRTLVARLSPLAGSGTQLGDRVISSVDVGTSLEVTPRIGEKNILLDLDLEVSSLLGFDGVGEPRISTRRAVTNIRVQDGEEVVFGGLERARRIQSTNKFPILGSLPVIGWAFGSEKSGVKKTMVVAVIRATRIKTGVPPDVARTAEETVGPEKTPLPKGQVGFDQWGFDK